MGLVAFKTIKSELTMRTVSLTELKTGKILEIVPGTPGL